MSKFLDILAQHSTFARYLTFFVANPIETKYVLIMNAKEYRIAIEWLALNKSNLEFPNSNEIHASIVLENIIRYAGPNVRIYDDTLDGDLDFDNAISNQITKYIEEDCENTLKIVIRNPHQSTSNIYSVLKELSISHSNQVDIRSADDKFISAVKEVYNKDLNFSTGDNAYRLEKMEKIGDKVIRKAVGSFNRPDKAKKLAQLFDDNFSKCPAFQF